MTDNTNRDEFAAFVTIFSLLVTIKYSNDNYDAWDLMLALIVFVFLTVNFQSIFKQFRTSIIAIFGYALSINTFIFCRVRPSEQFWDLDFNIFCLLLSCFLFVYFVNYRQKKGD